MGQTDSKEKKDLTQSEAVNDQNSANETTNQVSKPAKSTSDVTQENAEPSGTSSVKCSSQESSAEPKNKDPVTKTSDSSVEVNPQSSRRRDIPAGTSLQKRISFYETIDANEVLPNLIIGNLASSKNEEFLTRKNISYILNLTSDTTEQEFDNIHYKSVPLEDDDEQQLSPYFESCFEFINNAKPSPKTKTKKKDKGKDRDSTAELGKGNGVVLVHSYFGMSRTSAVVLAYLMKEKKWSLRQAYDHLTEKHSSANPNDNFVVQLLRYEQELFDGRMTMTLKDFYH